LQSPQHGNGKRFVQILTHFPTAWWSCILGKCLGYPSVWPRHMEWIPPRCSGVEGLVLQHPSCTRRFTLLFQQITGKTWVNLNTASKYPKKTLSNNFGFQSYFCLVKMPCPFGESQITVAIPCQIRQPSL
jgi:hypothetical protein